MEGDVANSRYWYGRAGGRRYEDLAHPRTEREAALIAPPFRTDGENPRPNLKRTQSWTLP